MSKRLLIAAAAALSVSAGQALAASPFSAIYAFGDSLSDAGNLYILSGIPSSPYYKGHFSNGQTWVEDLSQMLNLGPLTPSLAGGNDYAFGGAQTGPTLINPANPLPIDLPDQIGAYQKAHPAAVSGALYTLDIGANDILDGLEALQKGDITLLQFDTVVTEAIANTVTGVSELYTDGARKLLLYDVPQLSLTPDFNMDPPAIQDLADQLAQTFNAGVLSELRSLEKEGLTVYNLDTYDLLGEIVKNKGADGIAFTDVVDACIDVPACVGGSYAEQNQNLFWDGLHPTAAGHQITADYAAALVPEPSTWAMMILGLTGLGALGARRARAAAG